MKNDSELYKQICEYLGCDFDSGPCKEIQDHLAKCPSCEVYIDKVKKTVHLYKEIENCDEIPEKVCQKLFLSLNLNEPKTNESKTGADNHDFQRFRH